jgi:hypothetical protein
MGEPKQETVSTVLVFKEILLSTRMGMLQEVAQLGVG